jgi:hypothetical protein
MTLVLYFDILFLNFVFFAITSMHAFPRMPACVDTCTGSHAAVMDMKAMKRSRKNGNGPLVMKFPLLQRDGGQDSDEDSAEDLPIVLSTEITASGHESMFVDGNLMSNFLNATGGSSYDSPALPLLGVAFQHLLPSDLRDVKLPPPLSIDAISSLPPRNPLPPGAGFVSVSADTRAEVLICSPFNT